MTTKTDITLPPLPGALVDVETEARAYARAAVEANIQDHLRDAAKMVPSDDEIAAACKSLGWDLDAQEEADMILLVRTVLSRYSSGQPATRAAPVAQEPVGVVGDDFALYWIGSGPIAPIVERHGLKVGSKLYASPAAAQAQPDVQTLIAYAEGRIKHVNEGECPDNIEGHDTRDPDCPVCRALMGTIHAQPAMPPLTEAMRAVLRNENDIYGSEDAMYAALCDAAQAQPSASLKPDMQRESQRGAESGRDREDAQRWRYWFQWFQSCDDPGEPAYPPDVDVIWHARPDMEFVEALDIARARGGSHA